MVTDEATPKGTVVAVGPGKMSEKVRRVGEVSSRRPSLSAHSRRKWAVQCQCLVWRSSLSAVGWGDDGKPSADGDAVVS